jgi:hypothetical protein
VLTAVAAVGIEEHRGRFGVGPICRILGGSASAYYQRVTGARSVRAVADERLLDAIRKVHKANYEAYGPGKRPLRPHLLGRPLHELRPTCTRRFCSARRGILSQNEDAQRQPI